jgi:hypothetical protein
MAMKTIGLILLIPIFQISCSQKQDSNSIESPENTTLISSKKTSLLEPDTTVLANDIRLETSTSNKIIQKKNNKPHETYLRMVAFPSDRHFNGEPLIWQQDLALEVITAHPDTLKELAKQLYSSFTHSFPVSISDNFEEGISTKHIHYPKLTFIFQVFENQYEAKYYLEKQYVVKGDVNGNISFD